MHLNTDDLKPIGGADWYTRYFAHENADEVLRRIRNLLPKGRRFTVIYGWDSPQLLPRAWSGASLDYSTETDPITLATGEAGDTTIRIATDLDPNTRSKTIHLFTRCETAAEASRAADQIGMTSWVEIVGGTNPGEYTPEDRIGVRRAGHSRGQTYSVVIVPERPYSAG